ncbi:hypothetical protein NDR87_30855 [Nocardia sp. CDC159]|nr:hypothetical protein [Nocardia sp. CDC159]
MSAVKYAVLQLRRCIGTRFRRAGWHMLAAQVDTGPRVRLWDADWNLLRDSDRGEDVSFASFDGSGARMIVSKPLSTARWSGRGA